MKIAILIGAALLGMTGVAASPADAQRSGWNDRHDRGSYDYRSDRGRRDDRGWRGDRGRRDDRGWRDGRRDRGYGWNGGRGDRGRVVCRTHRDRYGPVRRCFRVGR